jgi:hypothetical protein
MGRPKAQVYPLSMESQHNYNLDLSMFERLVCFSNLRNSLAVLSVQRRMLPAICELVRTAVYADLDPELEDHELVKNYPPVKGMAQPLVFFDHDDREDGAKDDESRSKSNEFEVQMIVGFVGYMLHQGYAPGEITVITPYVGQLLKLR